MSASVKRILFRRSGTRNMFRRRESMGGATSSRGGAPSLSVGEGVPLGGGTPAERHRQSLGATARALDRPDRGGGERVRAHREGLRELAAAEHLHQPLLRDETARPQRARADLAAGV